MARKVVTSSRKRLPVKQSSEDDDNSGSDSGSSVSSSGSRSDCDSGSDSDDESNNGSGSGSDSGSSDSGSHSSSDSASSSEDERPAKKVKTSTVKPAANKPVKKSQALKPKSKKQPTLEKTNKQFDDGYASDLMGDAEDRAKLDSLPEVEREKILSERFDKRERMRREVELKQQLQKKSETATKGSKAKTSRVEEEDDNEVEVVPTSRNRSTRSRHDKNHGRKSALADLKRRREKLDSSSTRMSHLADDSDPDYEDTDSKRLELRDRRRRAQVDRSSVDGSDNSEVEHPYGKRKERYDDRMWVSESEVSETDEDPITVNDIIKYVWRPRRFFEEHFSEPYFRECVKGSFVRLSLGESGGKPTYVLCEVKRVQNMGKMYKMREQKTTQGLLLAQGRHERAWRMNVISDKKVTEREFDIWKRRMDEAGLKLPSRSRLEKMGKKIEDAHRKYAYSNKEVDEKIRRNQERGIFTGNLALRRIRLECDLKAAEYNGEEEKAKKLRDQLNKVMEKHEQRKHDKSESVLRINDINKKNREFNLKQDLQAGFFNEQALRNMSEEARLTFVRNPCKPRMYWTTDMAVLKGEKPSPSKVPKSKETEAGPSRSTLQLAQIEPEQKSETRVENPEQKSHSYLSTMIDPSKSTAGELRISPFSFDTNSRDYIVAGEAANKAQSSRNRVRQGLSLKDYFARAHAETSSTT